MRERRIVLLYCTDETERSWLSLLLDIRRYRVVGGISGSAPRPDLILIVDDGSLATVTMAASIGKVLPDVPMFIKTAWFRKETPSGYPAQAQFLPPQCKPMAMLERLRVVAARKPGPKKQSLVMA